MSRRRLSSALIGAALLACTWLQPDPAVAAVSCPKDTDEIRFCFANLVSLARLQQDNQGLWSDLQRAKTHLATAKTGAERAQVAGAAFADLKPEIAGTPNVPANVIGQLVGNLDAAIQWYRLAGTGAPPDDKIPVSIGRWMLDNTDETGSAGAIVKDWLTGAGCWAVVPKNKPECIPVLEAAVGVGIRVLVAREVVDEFNLPQRAKNLTEVTTRAAQWEAYLYGTQFQYAWELVANRYIDNSWRKIPEDPFGNELGLRIPPTNRGIFLHPDVGLQYISGQSNGDKVVAALTFEWLGYMQWKGYKDNKVDGLWGISVVSTVADERNAPKMGTGVMLHWGDYALAITSHGGHIAYTINLKLGDKLSTVNDTWAKEIQKPLDKAKQ